MITLVSPDGVPEVRPGDDLAALVLAAMMPEDGDVLVVTSKVVSKAEGQLVAGEDRDAALPGQTRRIVARRGRTTIVRNLLGLTMAAAGIDASNLEPGTLALLPVDPDASAASLRGSILDRAAVNVAVLISDTAGRAWRTGQTDIAIGAAGLVVLDDHTGRLDRYGTALMVTAPATADQLAGAAELAGGKLAARPFTLVRGRADLVLPVGVDGDGSASLVRPEGEDLFGYGAREAVIRALAGARGDRGPFGAPASAEELARAVAEVTGAPPASYGEELRVANDPRLAALAFAHGWSVEQTGGVSVLRPDTP